MADFILERHNHSAGLHCSENEKLTVKRAITV